MTEKEVLSKDVFEVYMRLNRDSLEDVKGSVSLIFHKLDEQSQTLVRNTATVEDHRRRSDNLEARQAEFMTAMGEIKTQLQQISISLIAIDSRANDIEKDIEPIQKHINEMQNLTNLLNIIYQNKGNIAKIIVFTIVILTGVYYGIKESDIILRLLK